MDNNQKILIAGIIIILIILVGAFALSGSHNATPTVTPTATPVTATPTPIPSGGSTGASTPTPSVVVSATPTPTPSVSATPEPASGVRQTEFGYWITYPPLGPENWSAPNTNLNQVPENNTVYFGPTSADVNVPYEAGGIASDDADEGTPAVIHRLGDLDGTTTVQVSVIPDNNMIFSDSLVGYYYIPDQSNITWINRNSNFSVTFNPTVSERTIYFEVWDIGEHETGVAATDAGSAFHGSVKLDIVGADDGYKVGSDHAFTLNVGAGTSVSFSDPDSTAAIYSTDGVLNWEGNLNSFDNSSSDVVTVTMPLSRFAFIDGTLPVTFNVVSVEDPGMPEGTVTIDPFAFTGSASQGMLTVSINKQYILDGNVNEIEIYIEDGSNYYSVYPEVYYIYTDQRLSE